MRRLQERGPLPTLRTRCLALAAAVAAVVVAADQITKSWALRALADEPLHLVWTLRLNISFNSGAAFGLAPGWAPLLIVVGVVIVLALVAFGRTAVRAAGPSAALGAVLGGALGNLADRLFRGHGGAVVDFIDLQWWPVFNLADAAITCGAVALAITAWGRPPAPSPPS